MTVAALTPRIREAVGLSAAYDAATIPAAVRRMILKLLRDYNFPKSIVQASTLNATLGQNTWALPAGFKQEKAVYFYDPVGLLWSDKLQRVGGLTMPAYPGVPTQYWIQGTSLITDVAMPSSGVGLSLVIYYQSQDVAANEDWMTADFEDVLFNLTCYRLTIEQRKPELTGGFQQLWMEDMTSLAKYANELEFDGLELLMRPRSDYDQGTLCRYPSTVWIT